MAYEARPILNTILKDELIDYVLEFFYDELKEKILEQEAESLRT